LHIDPSKLAVRRGSNRSIADALCNVEGCMERDGRLTIGAHRMHERAAKREVCSGVEIIISALRGCGASSAKRLEADIGGARCEGRAPGLELCTRGADTTHDRYSCMRRRCRCCGVGECGGGGAVQDRAKSRRSTCSELASTKFFVRVNPRT